MQRNKIKREKKNYIMVQGDLRTILKVLRQAISIGVNKPSDLLLKDR